jgi:hypothetical protein
MERLALRGLIANPSRAERRLVVVMHGGVGSAMSASHASADQAWPCGAVKADPVVLVGGERLLSLAEIASCVLQSVLAQSYQVERIST